MVARAALSAENRFYLPIGPIFFTQPPEPQCRPRLYESVPDLSHTSTAPSLQSYPGTQRDFSAIMNMHEYKCMNMHFPASPMRAKSVMAFLYHQCQQRHGPEKAFSKFFVNESVKEGRN